MAPSPTKPTLSALGIIRFWKPFQAFCCGTFWPILATDPSAIMKRVDQMEQVGKVYFTDVRLGSIRNTGQLEVTYPGKVFLSSAREVTTHDLCVIPIELNFKRRV